MHDVSSRTRQWRVDIALNGSVPFSGIPPLRVGMTLGSSSLVAGLVLFASFCIGSAHAGTAPADAGALAQLSLEDLLRVEVRSASRYAQPLADSPASVTVIEREEIERHGYRNLAEALSTVRGVYVSNDRNYSYLGVRGFNRPGDYNSRVLLLADGARQNDSLYDQAQIGNEAPIEIDWVKRLEFASGPASSVYGANALFGIVNAVMLEGKDVNGVRLSTDAGSGQSRRVGLIAGQEFGHGNDWFVGLGAYGAQGNDLYFPAFDTGPGSGWARGLDGESYGKAYGKVRVGDWRLTGSFSSRDKDLPNAPYLTAFGVPGTRTRDQHALVEVKYDGLLPSGWRQQLRLFGGSYRYEGHYRYSSGLDNLDLGRADWMGVDYRILVTTLASHKLLMGFEAQRSTRLEQRNLDLAPQQVLLNSNQPARTQGLFVQDEWRFQPKWLLNFGLRYDKHSDYAAIASPRLALIYQPTDAASLKVLLGSAYRPPNAYERFYDDGGVVQKANSALMPERIRSEEISSDFRLGQGGRIAVSAYRNTMRNMVDAVQDPADGLYLFANQPKTQVKGLELDAERRYARGARWRGSISRQWTRAADGSELGNAPRLLGKMNVSLPMASGWMLAGTLQGMSERIARVGRVPGYGVVNVTLGSGRRLGSSELTLGVYNLGNRRYADPASSAFAQESLAQDGRQIRLRWTLRL